MRVTRRFTILGCASSPGVPRINGDWGDCDPTEPRNRRRRSSLLVEQVAASGERTVVVIDTGPDFHAQMLSAEVEHLDAVIFTHAHADHIHGIDDLRGFALSMRRKVPVYADAATLERLFEAFGYCFRTPPGSNYPPIIEAGEIMPGEGPLRIDGPGGPIDFEPLDLVHGDIRSVGLRIGTFAYCCDVSGFPPATVERLRDLDMLVIDALQYREHPSHFSLAQALEWIERLAPRNARLTHMHTPLDYRVVLEETPPNVEPAYDMMVWEQGANI